ncbi:autophagy protein 16 [Phialemonium atrogriseum]|uniref:Autophagy protein 16 n=1 Tax=Phialemonium atrogriseum TaxID=1093897 RepID=A0AAJ0FMT2_9PEZI|nr:autophagy protein 16 [Phialemonium atrogriseum]KAK1768583.1 autophagy protein 16 [Phialemonium atrogriseum]
MPGWREEYLAAIREAERNNPVNRDLIEVCSQLADRIAVLEAERAAAAQTPADPTPARAAAGPATTTGEPPQSADPSSPIDGRLRVELAEAHRSRGQMQARLRAADDELVRLRARTGEDARALRELGAERRALVVRLRDRDDELRQKNKLVADVQDELAVLNLQLTVAERERAKAKDETRQLVDRWMRKMGQEAEDMNRANEPAMARNR